MTSLVLRLRLPLASSDLIVPLAVRETAERQGLQLVPQFPGVSDPDLGRYFVAQVPAASDAEAVALSLRSLNEVDSAYVQPDPSPAAFPS